MQGEHAADPKTSEAQPGKEVVGREDELERISAFVDAHHERPAALVVQGAAGIGKTTLWREAVRCLDAAGYRVLRTTPASSEASLSLATLCDLVEPVYHWCELTSRRRSDARSTSHLPSRSRTSSTRMAIDSSARQRSARCARSQSSGRSPSRSTISSGSTPRPPPR